MRIGLRAFLHRCGRQVLHRLPTVKQAGHPSFHRSLHRVLICYAILPQVGQGHRIPPLSRRYAQFRGEAVLEVLFHIGYSAGFSTIQHTNGIPHPVRQFSLYTGRLHRLLLAPQIQDLLNFLSGDCEGAFLLEHLCVHLSGIQQGALGKTKFQGAADGVSIADILHLTGLIEKRGDKDFGGHIHAGVLTHIVFPSLQIAFS